MSFQTTDADLAYVLTLQFIEEKPSEVIFQRRSRTQTSAGGFKLGEPTYLPKQRIRLVPGLVYADTVRTTSDGREIRPSQSLVAKYDADIENFDLFEVDDDEYEVVWVKRKELFQRTVGEVWRRGS